MDIKLLGICVAAAAGFLAFIAWGIYDGEKRLQKERKEWKEQGFSDLDILVMSLEERRDRLRDKLDNSRYGRWDGPGSVGRRFEMREELQDIEDRLEYWNDYRRRDM